MIRFMQRTFGSKKLKVERTGHIALGNADLPKDHQPAIDSVAPPGGCAQPLNTPAMIAGTAPPSTLVT